MRVRATEAFNAVRECQILTVAAGTVLDGDVAQYLLTTGAPVEQLDAPEPSSDPEELGDELNIDGKIEDILAWVGEDADRALEAHDAEEAKGDKARSTLLAKLAEIVQG